MKKSIILWVVLGILGIALAGVAGYYFGRNNNVAVSTAPTVETKCGPNEKCDLDTTNQNSNENKSADTIVETPTEPVALQTVTEGVTWLVAPEKIDTPDIYPDPNYKLDKNFYLVANLDSGEKIVSEVVLGLGTHINYFQVDKSGNYTLLANHADEYTVQSATDLYQSKVEINRELEYPEISDPDTIELDDLTLVKTYSFGDNEFFADQDNRSSYVKVGETDNGTLYSLTEDLDTTSNNGQLKAKTYVLVSADSSINNYVNAKPFLADDGSLQLDFTDTNPVYIQQTFMAGVSLDGCGSGGVDQVLPSSIPSEYLKEVGKATNGDTVYRLQYEQTNVFDVAYASYGVGRSAEFGNPPMSRDEYNRNAIILVWQDPAGDYIGFISSDFAPMVECGKPVVYLYPETTTNVTVEVGADVTISEPAYYNSDYNNMRGGWRTVAQPNGQLTMPNGNIFGNLYWEGKGFGTYPAITQGRIIESKNFEAEVRADMTKLGLNAQEQQDFMDFWQEYVPAEPYTRLSWLDTRAMDVLAPLNISPKPDTVKRVFLDFAGQTSPETDLQPQTLTGFKRKGFTVVEWGGLLVGGVK